ncbi:MAG: hypothetical protein R2737_00370 [Candidatus Nanopelagicales bacterium]
MTRPARTRAVLAVTAVTAAGALLAAGCSSSTEARIAGESSASGSSASPEESRGIPESPFPESPVPESPTAEPVPSNAAVVAACYDYSYAEFDAWLAPTDPVPCDSPHRAQTVQVYRSVTPPFPEETLRNPTEEQSDQIVEAIGQETFADCDATIEALVVNPTGIPLRFSSSLLFAPDGSGGLVLRCDVGLLSIDGQDLLALPNPLRESAAAPQDALRYATCYTAADSPSRVKCSAAKAELLYAQAPKEQVVGSDTWPGLATVEKKALAFCRKQAREDWAIRYFYPGSAEDWETVRSISCLTPAKDWLVDQTTQ